MMSKMRVRDGWTSFILLLRNRDEQRREVCFSLMKQQQEAIQKKAIEGSNSRKHSETSVSGRRVRNQSERTCGGRSGGGVGERTAAHLNQSWTRHRGYPSSPSRRDRSLHRIGERDCHRQLAYSSADGSMSLIETRERKQKSENRAERRENRRGRERENRKYIHIYIGERREERKRREEEIEN